MIKPLYRAGLTVGVMAVLLVAVGAWRMLQSHGAFTEVKPGFSGTCRVVASPAGPEDIAIDQARKLAFVSAMDRQAFRAGKPSSADGIYTYAYGDSAAKPVKVEGGPKDFHPHGISLTHDKDGALVLLAINHLAAGGHTIEVLTLSFDGGKAKMTETGRITSGMLISPNAVAAQDPSHFYVVNYHVETSRVGQWLDDNLVLPRANILYFSGDRFKVVADKVNVPNGAALSPDGRHLYVAQSFARVLSVFDVTPYSGQLTEAKTVSIPGVLDNVRVDQDGAVWVAAKPKPWAMGPYRKDASKLVPSAVYRVTPDGAKADLVYAGDGKTLSGVSVAAVMGKTLLIGSAFGRKIANCSLP